MALLSGSTDTIVAQATPPGQGGVGIIRVSGSSVADVCQTILGNIPSPRLASYQPFKSVNGETLDIGLALYFKAPNSFTGEDVLELHAHGGQVILDMLMREICSLDIRIAEPGEFSKRAFLNDKLDLAQAEAIADLINASTETAARSAVHSLSGEFSSLIRSLLEKLIHVRMYIESAIDFPEEEIDFLSDARIRESLDELAIQFSTVLSRTREGVVLNEGMRVVILGQPNAGKSSLLNAFTGEATAIVTDVPGTTRDVIRETIQIDGMPLVLIDTAGIREGADIVESEGIKRAWDQVNSADRILLVVDGETGITNEDRTILKKIEDPAHVTIILNKQDIAVSDHADLTTDFNDIFKVSAKTGFGLQSLKQHLKNIMGYSSGEGAILARRRHLEALEAAKSSLEMAVFNLETSQAGELAAEDLRQAQFELNKITGEFDNEDLLGEIFSSFCIGK